MYQRGLNCEERHRSDSAFLYYQQAVVLLERGKEDEHERLLRLYHKMGRIMLKHGLDEEAFKYMRRALTHAFHTDNVVEQSKAYREVAGIYGYQGKYDSSMVYYRRAQKLLPRVTIEERSNLYNNLARIYLFKKDLDSALLYNGLAITSFVDSQSLYSDYYTRARIYETIGLNDSARHYYQLAVLTDDLYLKVGTYKRLSRMATSIGWADSSFYTHMLVYWDDSLNWTKKTVEVGRFNFDLRLGETRHSYHVFIGFILFFVLSVIGTFGAVIWRRKRHQRILWDRFRQEHFELKNELFNRKQELSRIANAEEEMGYEKEKLLIIISELQSKWETHLNGLSSNFDLCMSRLTSLKEYAHFIDILTQYRTRGVLPYTHREWIASVVQRYFGQHLYMLQTFYGLTETYSLFYCYTRLGFSTWQIALCMGCTQETVRSYRTRIKPLLQTHADGQYLLQKAFPNK